MDVSFKGDRQVAKLILRKGTRIFLAPWGVCAEAQIEILKRDCVVSRRGADGGRRRAVKPGRAAGKRLSGGELLPSAGGGTVMESHKDWDLPVFDPSRSEDRSAARAAARGGLLSWGEFVLATGQWASKRQARQLLNLRGREASFTSIEESGSAAVLAVVRGVSEFVGPVAADWAELPPASWEEWRRRVALPGSGLSVWLLASRAAFASLSDWSSGGMTGREEGRGAVSFVGAPVADMLPADCSLPGSGGGAWGADSGEHSRRARWAVCRWVWQVGVRDYLLTISRASAWASARRAAVARWRAVSAMVLLGDSLQGAAERAGFASVQTFLESAKSSGFFSLLARAQSVAAAWASTTYARRVRAAALRAARAARAVRIGLSSTASAVDVSGPVVGWSAMRQLSNWRLVVAMGDRALAMVDWRAAEAAAEAAAAANRAAWGRIVGQWTVGSDDKGRPVKFSIRRAAGLPTAYVGVGRIAPRVVDGSERAQVGRARRKVPVASRAPAVVRLLGRWIPEPVCDSPIYRLPPGPRQLAERAGSGNPFAGKAGRWVAAWRRLAAYYAGRRRAVIVGRVLGEPLPLRSRAGVLLRVLVIP